MNWSELIEPTIELCETGAIVNNYLSDYLKSKAHIIKSEPTLAEIFINPETKEVWTVNINIFILFSAKKFEFYFENQLIFFCLGR